MFVMARQSIVMAGLVGQDGEPPCGDDGICNAGVCFDDPDCDLPGPDPVRPPPSPDRPEDFDDCSALEVSEIGYAIDWGADNWTAFEAYLEDYHDWSVNIGNCLESRFKTDGKVECEASSSGSCNGNNGWASALSQTAHMCPGFLNTVADLPDPVENRQACYFALATHEWGHTCERGHVTLEIMDDAAFEFFKLRHPEVSIEYWQCGMA